MIDVLRQNWTSNSQNEFKGLFLDEQIQRLLYFLKKTSKAIEFLNDEVRDNY